MKVKDIIKNNSKNGHNYHYVFIDEFANWEKSFYINEQNKQKLSFFCDKDSKIDEGWTTIKIPNKGDLSFKIERK